MKYACFVSECKHSDHMMMRESALCYTVLSILVWDCLNFIDSHASLLFMTAFSAAAASGATHTAPKDDSIELSCTDTYTCFICITVHAHAYTVTGHTAFDGIYWTTGVHSYKDDIFDSGMYYGTSTSWICIDTAFGYTYRRVDMCSSIHAIFDYMLRIL